MFWEGEARGREKNTTRGRERKQERLEENAGEGQAALSEFTLVILLFWFVSF